MYICVYSKMISGAVGPAMVWYTYIYIYIYVRIFYTYIYMYILI